MRIFPRHMNFSSVFLSIVFLTMFLLFEYSLDSMPVPQTEKLQKRKPEAKPVCLIRSEDMCFLGTKKDKEAKRGVVYCEGPMFDMKCENHFRSILRTDCNGRLGNVMMSYATMFYFKKKGFNAIQTEYQMSIFNEVFDPTFSIKEGILEPYDRVRLEVFVGDEDEVRDIQYDYFLDNLDKYRDNRVLYVGRYPTPFNLFVEIWPDLMKEFKFKQDIVDSARLAIDNSTQHVRDNYPDKKFVYIGIHNRRGDYVNYKHLKDVFEDDQVLVRFFHYAMNIYRERFDTPTTKTLFLMLGNDQEWNEQFFSDVPDLVFPYNHYVMKDEWMPARDMVILARCDHTIRTWGTFSLWASLMTNGTSIYATTHGANRDERHLELLEPALKKNHFTDHIPVDVYQFFNDSRKSSA